MNFNLFLKIENSPPIGYLNFNLNLKKVTKMEKVIMVEMEGKEVKIPLKGKGIRVDKLLENLGIFPETAVVLKEGKLLCDDERVKAGDKIKIVVATSKG